MRASFLWRGVTLAALLAAGLAQAGELRVSVSQTLSASPEEVWQEIGRFGQLSWHPAVAATLTRGNPDKAGAQREITTVDGAVLVEKLLARDPRQHSLRYRIEHSPLPVTGYVSTLQVLPGPFGGSKVVWSSRFQRTADIDDAGARQVVSGIYTAGLQALIKTFGSSE